MLNGLDLFSGIGGLSLALSEWVRPIAYCEIDPYVRGVLLSRMAEGFLPEAPIHHDVTKLNSETLCAMRAFHEEEADMAGRLKKLTQEQVADATRNYEQGMSLGDLAHVYGVTRQAMWDLLRRRTTLRPQARFGNENHFYRGGRRSDARAHDVVDKAIQSGRLVNPGVCETCGASGRFTDGRTAIQAHHDDYNHPLNVRWLCQPCHHEWHRNNQPVPVRKGGEEGSPAVDIIYGGFP